MTAIVISIIALTISLILATRLFLLDKDYCEFSIIDQGGGNTGLMGVSERKLGYILTLLRPKIKLLKSDIYDVEISGIDQSNIILPNTNINKTNKMVHLNNNDVIELKCFYSEPQEIKISYRDSKNNLYEQTLSVMPFYNSGSLKNSKQWSVSLTNRKWSFINSFKRKYL